MKHSRCRACCLESHVALATLTACIVQTSNPSRRCFLANCYMTSWEETRICSCHGDTFVRSRSSESHKTSNSCLSRCLMKMPWAPEAKLEEAFNIVSRDHARDTTVFSCFQGHLRNEDSSETTTLAGCGPRHTGHTGVQLHQRSRQQLLDNRTESKLNKETLGLTDNTSPS